MNRSKAVIVGAILFLLAAVGFYLYTSANNELKNKAAAPESVIANTQKQKGNKGEALPSPTAIPPEMVYQFISFTLDKARGPDGTLYDMAIFENKDMQFIEAFCFEPHNGNPTFGQSYVFDGTVLSPLDDPSLQHFQKVNGPGVIR